MGIVARATLVLSNLVFALPLYTCLQQANVIMKTRGLRIGQRYVWFVTPEAALFGFIIFFSGFYHACDSGSDACKLCIAGWLSLNHADFALSMTIAAIPLFWGSDVRLWRWKCFGLGCALVGNLVYVQVAFPLAAVSIQ